MKAYHTYSAVDVAWSLLKHAKEQGKCFSNLQLQKLTYVCHGLSLAHFQRPLVVDDVFAWKFNSVVPSVYFRFKSYGSSVIPEQCDVALDQESESIVKDVVSKLGHLTCTPTCRFNSPRRKPMASGMGWHTLKSDSRPFDSSPLHSNQTIRTNS